MQNEEANTQYNTCSMYGILPCANHGIGGNTNRRQLERTANPYKPNQQSFGNPFQRYFLGRKLFNSPYRQNRNTGFERQGNRR